MPKTKTLETIMEQRLRTFEALLAAQERVKTLQAKYRELDVELATAQRDEVAALRAELRDKGKA